MGMIGDILGGRIRAEMKSRTDEILAAIREHKQALDRHSQVLEKVLAAQGAFNEGTNAELRRSTAILVKSEKRLCRSVDGWTGFMAGIVGKLG